MSAASSEEREVELACAEQLHHERQLLTYYLFLFGVLSFGWLHGFSKLAEPENWQQRLGLCSLYLILLLVFSHLWGIFALSTVVAGDSLAALPGRFPNYRKLYLQGDRGVGLRLCLVAALPFASFAYLGWLTLLSIGYRALYALAVLGVFSAVVLPQIYTIHASLTRETPHP